MVGGPGHGKITSGIQPGALVRRTTSFIRENLPAWRDDPEREHVDSEESLNAQLCKFLNVVARQSDFSMVYFHHEERQSGRRRVDLSALPTLGMWIGPRHHSIYDPFLVMEGKRLPAPTLDREREYVTGGEKLNGGIQRFKLGLHGASVRAAALIGYVQDGTPAEWHTTINEWISNLTGGKDKDEIWSLKDRLQKLTDDPEAGVSMCESVHLRVNAVSDRAQMSHLWVEMAAGDE